MNWLTHSGKDVHEVLIELKSLTVEENINALWGLDYSNFPFAIHLIRGVIKDPSIDSPSSQTLSYLFIPDNHTHKVEKFSLDVSFLSSIQLKLGSKLFIQNSQI